MHPTAGWTVPTVSPLSTNPVSKFIRYDLHCPLESDGNSHKSLLRSWKTEACNPKALLKAAKFCSCRPWPSPALQHEVRVKLKSMGWHVSSSGMDGKRFGSVIYEAKLYLLLMFSHLESLPSSLSEKASHSTAGGARCCVQSWASCSYPTKPEGVEAESWKAPWEITQSKPCAGTGCKTSRLSLMDVSLPLS